MNVRSSISTPIFIRSRWRGGQWKSPDQEHDDFKNLPIRENLLTRMQDAGVTLSVNLPVVSKPQNQAEVNRFAKESARKNIIPVRADFIRTVKMWRRSWKN